MTLRITVLPFLFLVLLVLKLTHVIAWSWWWVTVPVWGPVVILVAIYVGMFVVGFLHAMLTDE